MGHGARSGTAIILSLLICLAVAGCRGAETLPSASPTIETTPGEIAPGVNTRADVTALLPTVTPTPVPDFWLTRDFVVTEDTEAGLLLNVIEVDRHGVDLPAFLEASVEELAADTRITVTDRTIDGNIRADGIPVSVIRFTIAEHAGAVLVEGTQYAAVAPDGDSFWVLTCAAVDAHVGACDLEMAALTVE